MLTLRIESDPFSILIDWGVQILGSDNMFPVQIELRVRVGGGEGGPNHGYMYAGSDDWQNQISLQNN